MEELKYQYALLLAEFEKLSREYAKFNKETEKIKEKYSIEIDEKIKKILDERKIIYNDFLIKFENINKRAKILQEKINK